MKSIISFCLLLFFNSALFSQTIKDSIRNEMIRLNTITDNSYMLSFDLTINYKTDTVLGDFQNRTISGAYIMNGKQYYYKMGSIEVLQNDSILLSVDNSEKLIMVGKPSMNVLSSGALPTRALIDSTLSLMDSIYSYQIYENDSNRIMKFTSVLPAFPVKEMEIHYSKTDYRMEGIFYKMTKTDYMPQSTDTLGVNPVAVVRNTTMSIIFTNYKIAMFEPSVFNHSAFITEYTRGKFTGAKSFAAYSIHKAFVEEGDISDEAEEAGRTNIGN